jgi:superfamily I DNA/RNA helicase
LEGYTVVSWPNDVGGWVARARGVGMRRNSLDSAAQDWLDWLDQVDRLAVVDVDLASVEDVADLLGFVVEPAARRGVQLAIVARQEIEDLDDADFVDPEFGYAYSLERLRWRLRGAPVPTESGFDPPDGPDFDPDPTQAAAVGASEGVVQIIAPAGSGKTTVLVERVRELRRRGVPAAAIACVTFNRAAKEEMETRLLAAGVGNVEAYTFHGLGLRMLRDARAVSRNTKFGSPTQGEWRRLAWTAKTEAGSDGVWINPSEAAEKLSQIKLGLLLTPEEYTPVAAASEDPEEVTMAALYVAYEEKQREVGRMDFDDMVLKAVLLLRENEQIRGQWQTRFQQLLVDEYQDIEPAQELIVRIVGAPHDRLFCVGDEDQTLYAFRRASVERIICLDGLYPGLQRVSLGINYRCPERVVRASRSLINLNRVRFRKPIESSPHRDDDGVISLLPFERQAEDAADTAKLLKTMERGEVTVLGRTTNALRPLALACADIQVPIDGNPKLFEPSGARLALQQHLRLAFFPEEATDQLVHRVCQTPSRGLGGKTKASHDNACRIAAQRLRRGDDFEAAFEGALAPRRDRGSLLAPGELFTALADCESGDEAIALLRGEGGLEAWFEESDDLGGLDQFEVEALEQAEEDAADQTPTEFLADLEYQAEELRATRDEENGIEFLTIHGAKGRQWPRVIVVSCEEGTMPHTRALKVDAAEEARGEGIEAERRLAYVAFTRAKERLDLHFDEDRPSPFLIDAGLLSAKQQPGKGPPPVPKPDLAAVKDGLAGLFRRGR